MCFQGTQRDQHSICTSVFLLFFPLEPSFAESYPWICNERRFSFASGFRSPPPPEYPGTHGVSKILLRKGSDRTKWRARPPHVRSLNTCDILVYVRASNTAKHRAVFSTRFKSFPLFFFFSPSFLQARAVTPRRFDLAVFTESGTRFVYNTHSFPFDVNLKIFFPRNFSLCDAPAKSVRFVPSPAWLAS